MQGPSIPWTTNALGINKKINDNITDSKGEGGLQVWTRRGILRGMVHASSTRRGRDSEQEWRR